MIKFSQFFGLILLVFMSFQNPVLTQFIPENLANNRDPTLTEIQQEIYPSVRRLSPVLYTWIIVTALFSTATTTTAVLILLFSVQKTKKTQQNIDAMKQDTISDLHQHLSQAQTVVNELQYSVQVSQDKVQKISSQTFRSLTVDDPNKT